MKKKRNYLTKVVAILLACVLFITGIGIENVSAFWNNDNPTLGDKRQLALITVKLMHCNHSDENDPYYSKHWVNGKHTVHTGQGNTSTNEKAEPNPDELVNPVSIQPGVLGDTQAGLESIDTNKYFYEYSLTYAESELVDYVLITQPEITHYSDNDSKKPANLREEHVRMYWIGSYNKSMTEVTDEWSERYIDNGNTVEENKPDGNIGWFDFKYESFPTIDPQLSQQTWETVGDHDAFQNNKSFVFTKSMG